MMEQYENGKKSISTYVHLVQEHYILIASSLREQFGLI
jgi:hypothetical protein